MKRSFLLFAVLIALSVLSGVLMSDSSWIGKVGISLMHREYNLTKIWWQGATAVFIVDLLFYFLHSFIYNKLPVIIARMAHFVLALSAAAGLYLTWDDFHTTLSHRLLGWRFHYGFYVVWIGWMVIAISFLLKKKKQNIAAKVQDNKELAA